MEHKMSRESIFQIEMKLADTMRKLLSEKNDYEIADVIKHYMTFLRKCYHGENFESSNGVYKNGEILDLKIAQSMFAEFKNRLSEYCLCNIQIEQVCCDDMVANIKNYMAGIGQKGGKNGTGDSKRRSPDHYKKMVEIRNAKKQK
jgi:hypothetical protein